MLNDDSQNSQFYEKIKSIFDHRSSSMNSHLSDNLNPFLTKFIDVTKGIVCDNGKKVIDFIKESLDHIGKIAIILERTQTKPESPLPSNPLEVSVQHKKSANIAVSEEDFSFKSYNEDDIHKIIMADSAEVITKQSYELTKEAIEHFKSELEKAQKMYSEMYTPYSQILKLLKSSTIQVLLYKFPKNQRISTIASAYSTIKTITPKVIEEAKQALISGKKIENTKHLAELLIAVFKLLNAAEKNKKKLENILLTIEKKEDNIDTLLTNAYVYFYYNIKKNREEAVQELNTMNSYDVKLNELKTNLVEVLAKENQIIASIYEQPQKDGTLDSQNIPKHYEDVQVKSGPKDDHNEEVSTLSTGIKSYYDNSLFQNIFSKFGKDLLLFVDVAARVKISFELHNSSNLTDMTTIYSTNVTEAIINKLVTSNKDIDSLEQDALFATLLAELQNIFEEWKKKQETFKIIVTELQNVLTSMDSHDIGNITSGDDSVPHKLHDVYNELNKIYQSVN